MTTPANQQIGIDDEILQRQARTLAEAADVLERAAGEAANGVGSHAFGVMCAPLLGPVLSAVAETSRHALTAAAQVAEGASVAVGSAATGFSQVEQDAVSAFRTIEESAP